MISYSFSIENLEPRQLRGFFVGWPNPPSPETHLRILKQSHTIVLALDDESGQVVGFINAISDGVLSAYIPLLEVLPEYQKRGIGGELVRRMLKLYEDLYMIDLICDKERIKFYSRFGMKAITGMMIRNFERQSGVL
jgi:ribosomal protein S18 acetylase RimI-like enzyme